MATPATKLSDIYEIYEKIFGVGSLDNVYDGYNEGSSDDDASGENAANPTTQVTTGPTAVFTQVVEPHGKPSTSQTTRYAGKRYYIDEQFGTQGSTSNKPSYFLHTTNSRCKTIYVGDKSLKLLKPLPTQSWIKYIVL